MMSIVLLKLLNGEQVICKLLQEKEDCFIIQDPVVFTAGRDQKGVIVPVPIPWILGTKGNTLIEIRKQVLATNPIPQEHLDSSLVNIYTQLTTGLTIPNPQTTQKIRTIKH